MAGASAYGFREDFKSIMSRNLNYIAGIVLLLTVLAWIGVGALVFFISSKQSDRVAQASSVQSVSNQNSQATYLHTLVADSKDARDQLSALFNVDPSALANTINATGKSAGVHLQITSALSDSALAVPTAGSVQSFSFIATAQGSFQDVMYAATLLETLPVPSSVRQIEFTHTVATPGSASNAGPWQMSAQVKILTVSSISS